MIGAVNCVTLVVATPHIRVERFAHAPGVSHVDAEREVSPAFGLHFVETGGFSVRTDGGWTEVTTQRMFVTAPGLEFSCRHAEECPQDRCTSIVYSEAAIESARSVGTMASPGVRPLTNRTAYLRTRVRDETVDPACAEAAAGAMLLAIDGGGPRMPLFPAHRLAWYAARVDRAKEYMRSHHADPLSLSVLARDAGMSVFHFARTFAALEGQPPHKFLMEVRLARARDALRAGASVTEVCYQVGFQSLSHFATTFRRRFGISPSRVARGRSVTRS